MHLHQFLPQYQNAAVQTEDGTRNFQVRKLPRRAVNFLETYGLRHAKHLMKTSHQMIAV